MCQIFRQRVRWDQIFTHDASYRDDQYQQEWEILKESYNHIPETEWGTLSACVDYAIQEGNHAAFAKYYIRKAQSKESLFRKKLNYYINGMESGERWENFLLIEPAKWRSPGYDYTVNADRGDFLTKQSLANWRDGAALPKRDVIVEIGICLGLGSGQVNELLRLAGYEELYPFDLVDMIGWYYLDYYSQSGVNLCHAEKLTLIKRQMNLYMRKNLEGPQGTDSEEMRGNLKVIREKSKKKRTPCTEQIGSVIPLSENIEEWMGRWKSQLPDKPGDGDDTDFLTVFFDKKLSETITNRSLEQFLDEYLGNETMQGLYSLRHYGYLKKTIDFLNAPKCYIKNTRYSSLSLTTEQKISEVIYESENYEYADYINPYCRKFTLAVCKGNDSRYHNRSAYIKVINDIWKLVNVVNESDYRLNGETHTTKGRYLKVLNLIDGRRIEGIPDDGFDEKEVAYVSDTDKKSLMKYAVATGNEDQIGRYLELAGFWEKDLGRMEEDLEEWNCDRTDLLMIYALKYRNRLLDCWCKQMRNSGRDRYLLKSKLAGDFPFLKLLMVINQDIQFASKEIERWETWDSLWGDMVYPVKKTSSKWATGSKIAAG